MFIYSNRAVVPTIQGYEDAGDFTVKERLKTSIHMNLLFYSIVGAIGLIGLILLLIMHRAWYVSIFTWAKLCTTKLMSEHHLACHFNFYHRLSLVISWYLWCCQVSGETFCWNIYIRLNTKAIRTLCLVLMLESHSNFWFIRGIIYNQWYHRSTAVILNEWCSCCDPLRT